MAVAKKKKKAVKKTVRKKTVKKAVRRKPVKRKVARKKVVRKKVARKKPVKRKSVKKTVRKKVKSIKRKVVRAVAKRKKSYKKKAGKAIRRIASSKGMQDTLMKGGGVVAGAVGAGVMANYVPIKDPRIKAIMPIVAGLLLSNVKMFKGKMGQAMTLGMVAAGGLAIVKQFAPQVPVLAGEADLVDYLTPEEQEAAMLGYYPEDEEDDENYLGASIEDDVDGALEGESEEIGDDEEDWIDTSDL